LIQSIRIVDAGETRDYHRDNFPLSLGVGDGVAVQLSGVKEEGTHAFLGMSDLNPFIQPVEDHEVFLNNEQIFDSCWLYDGDTILIESARILYRSVGQSLVFQIETAQDEKTIRPQVQPPSTPPVQAVSVKTDSYLQRKPIVAILSLAFICLLLVCSFVFSAKSVSIQIRPEPDNFDIEGGFLKFNLADRHLLLPGNYFVIAQKQGYRLLKEMIEVNEEQTQEKKFSLQILPGYLNLSIHPLVKAELVIDGEKINNVPSKAIELSAGKHIIAVDSERYLHFQTDFVTEGKGKTQKLAINLIPKWAPISIASDPSGASIWIDDKEKGLTPLTVDILDGVHTLKAQLEGYSLEQLELVVKANQPQTIPKIFLKKADGKLSVNSSPRGATVTVDGIYRGQTPLDLSLISEADHRVVLTKTGHESTIRTINIEPAKQAKLDIKMVPKLGYVMLNVTPSGGRIYVDGKQIKSTQGKIRLSAIPHTLEIKKKGYQNFKTQITPSTVFTKEISAKLSAVKSKSGQKSITTAAGQKMLYVKPGRFSMGASRREQGRRANETLRTVELTRPFYLAVMEVTNAQFRAFKPDHRSGSIQRHSLDQNDLPVVQVTWEEAASYCNWLSERDSLTPVYIKNGHNIVARKPIPSGYRLPTEAEWAWVARFSGGNTPLKYPWGSGFPPTRVEGNYADTSSSTLVASALSNYSDNFPATAPVGSFKPNTSGFYDLGGNVAEWVHDYYTVYPSVGAQPLKDPSGQSQGTHHTIRGSSWKYGTISQLRFSYRDYSQKKRPDVGFRIAKYTDQ